MPPESRPMSFSRAELTRLIMPHMQNVLGSLFGGELMAMVDQAAAVVAIRHAGGPVLTAAIDRVDFREPIPIGALVTLLATVDFVGNSSMDITVEVCVPRAVDASHAARADEGGDFIRAEASPRCERHRGRPNAETRSISI